MSRLEMWELWAGLTLRAYQREIRCERDGEMGIMPDLYRLLAMHVMVVSGRKQIGGRQSLVPVDRGL